jgi:hypothetical protein
VIFFVSIWYAIFNWFGVVFILLGDLFVLFQSSCLLNRSEKGVKGFCWCDMQLYGRYEKRRMKQLLLLNKFWRWKWWILLNALLGEGNFSHPLVCFFTPCAALYAPEKKVLLTRAELLFNLNPPNFFLV